MRLTHRRVGVFRCRRRDTLFGKHFTSLSGQLLHGFGSLRIRQGAPAHPGGDHRDASLWRVDAEMQRGVTSHRMTDNMCPLDSQPIENGDDIVARDILTITCDIVRDVRWRIAALTKGDASM